MRYIPHTQADTQQMLGTIGAAAIDELFDDIPASLRLSSPPNIPAALDEHAILKNLEEISKNNQILTSFLGAGAYEHYVPSIVMELVSRGEFLSAYTPYQPEASQGYLQTIYEFQSMICAITGMDAANASMYDGGTALAEACIMASGVKNRSKLILSSAVHPHYRKIVETFAEPAGAHAVTVSDEQLFAAIDDQTACVAVQYPDFFGRVRSPKKVIEAAHAAGALAVVVSDPVALGVLNPPGDYGADVVVGEAQSLGVPLGYGGPMVGFFCVRRELIRAIPGRIVGKTHDADSRRGFVMTLRTREQDIRREKATSNICTNQALMALVTTVWMSALGKSGFRAVAESCVQKAHYLAGELLKIPGVSLTFPNDPFAFEFAVDLGRDAEHAADRLLDSGYIAGLPLGRFDQNLRNSLLISVSETKSKQTLDAFALALAKVCG